MINLQNVEIAKVQKGDFTLKDLEELVSNFNPSKHEPPVVLGHPKTNSPAYGWVKSLYLKGKSLVANLEVHKSLLKFIDEGLYKKKSISYWTNYQGTGKKVLIHLGFLGGVPPQIKGLPDGVSLKDGDEFETIDLEEDRVSRMALRDVAIGYQKHRDHLIDTEGLEKANEIVPVWLIDSLKGIPLEELEQPFLFSEKKETEVSMKDDGIKEVNFTQTQHTAVLEKELEKQKAENTKEFKEEIKTLTDQVTEKDKKIVELTDGIKDLKEGNIKIEVTNFVEGLVKDFKLEPTRKDEVIKILSDKDITVDFREKLKKDYSSASEIVESKREIFDNKNEDGSIKSEVSIVDIMNKEEVKT